MSERPIVGLDPSLRATGLALPDGEMLTIKTPSCTTLDDRIERVRRVIGRVANRIDGGAMVVIEGPAFGMNNRATHELSGLWWSLVVRLTEQGNRLAVLSPGQLKKFATGKGNAPKPDMRMALYQRTGIDVADDNQVDAWWLRQAGQQRLDQLGALTLPKTQTAVLDGIAWPEGL